GARPGVPDRVRRHPVRLVLARRVPGDVRRLGDRGHLLPRRLDGAGPGMAGPDLADRQEPRPDLRLHLGPGDAAAAALRPADEPRVEGAAPARDPEHRRHRGPGGGHVSEVSVSERCPYLAGETEVIAVQRGPEPGGAKGAYRAF